MLLQRIWADRKKNCWTFEGSQCDLLNLIAMSQMNAIANEISLKRWYALCELKEKHELVVAVGSIKVSGE